MSLLQAHDYLSPKENSFWRWSIDGSAIEWTDGRTIAFREEIAKTLHRLRPHGLPSFDLIALLLAACRRSWIPDAKQLDLLMSAIWGHGKMIGQELNLLLSTLERVSSLPELKESAELKAEMVSMVLEKHPLRAPRMMSDLILIEFDHGFPYESGLDFKPKPTAEWLGEFRGLIEALHEFDPDSLELSKATGLTELPEPADSIDEIVNSSSFSLRDFLSSLEADQELGGLARLARQLYGFVHLPRDIQEEEDLFLGGVSDIANRGQFDRLLISELANDSDVLMNRVALSEALYLRREKTTIDQKSKRKILLDCGIRMWGLPRIFATSAALSLASLCDQSSEIFRAAGIQPEPVDYSTREGLTDHLSRLELSPHPGASLRAFGDDPDAEQFYIVGEETLADENFQKLLASTMESDHYILTVNRSGRLRIYSCTHRGRRLIRESTLDLDVLFPQTHTTQSLIDPSRDPQMSAIDRLRKFPLRLSHQVDHNRVAGIVEAGSERKCLGALAITNDHRLMWWDRTDVGGIQLLPYVHVKKFLCVNRDQGIVRAVIGDENSPHRMLIRFDLNTLECQVFMIDCPKAGLLNVTIHHGTVMFVFRDDVRFFDSQSAAPIGKWNVQGATWISNRFFVSNGALIALSHNGLGPTVVTLSDSLPPHPMKVVSHVFDSEARDSPVLIDPHGYLQIPPEEPFKINFPKNESMTVSQIDSQGNRIAFKSASNPLSGGVIWLHDMSFQPSYHALAQFSHDWWSLIRQRSLRVRLQSMAVASGNIILRGSRGKSLAIDYLNTQRRLQIVPAGGRFGLLGKTFEKFTSAPRKQWSRRATWNDGSSAILDHRGLLHLKSSDASIPEVTLVLYDEHVSGWCSNGTVFGDPYFHIDGWRTVDSLEVMETVLKPFVWRLR